MAGDKNILFGAHKKAKKKNKLLSTERGMVWLTIKIIFCPE